MSHKKGYSFENNVADLYRLLHYDVEHGRLFSGRQVDLFITRRLGDLTIYRALECKAGPVKTDDIDDFLIKLRLVRHEYPSALGTLISGSSFTNAVSAHAAREGIQLTFYRDLAAQLLDGHRYAQNLLREIRSNERYPIKLFIEPTIGYDTIGDSVAAYELIQEWLDDAAWNQLTLLGDVGTGKSFLSRMVAHNLAVEFLKNPLEKPLPILIDLRNADRQFSLEGLILTHLSRSGLEDVSFDVFQYVLSQGQLVLILDGFDEMAARVTPQVTERNFQELSRCVKGRAKVLLTCRTHYFKSRTEEEEVVFGGRDDYGSETARDLYWELISRKGFNIAYIRPFDILQIDEYVRLARPTDARQALDKIRGTYNLIELSQRPMLLEMIVKSLDKLTAAEINASTLYRVFTDVWIHRDQWREVVSPEHKLNFLMGLSRSLWDQDLSSIHYTRLNDYVRVELAPQIEDAQQFIEIDSEIRTASFLTRDKVGHYSFAHKSYSEYFFARYLASQFEIGNLSCLNTRRISTEVLNFLLDMIDSTQLEAPLEEILLRPYTPLLSENALVCLYGMRRSKLLAEGSSEELIVPLPVEIDLTGAQLDQVTLDGAVMTRVNLCGANLSEAILARASLCSANLREALLQKADLSETDLSFSDLTRSKLTATVLRAAKIVGAKFHEADLTDAYLAQADYEGADFQDATLTGAILPEELDLVVRGRLEARFSEMVREADSEEPDKYWAIILELRPIMIRAANLIGLASGEDPEDVVSELVIRLRRSQGLDKLLAQKRKKQKDYIYWLARSVAKERSLKQERSFEEFRRRRPVERGIEEEGFDLSRIENADEGDYLLLQRGEDRLIEEDETDTREFRIDDESITRYFEAIPGESEGPFEDVLIREIRDSLSPRLWNIVEARFISGDSLEEIAQAEELSVPSVQKLIRKARETLARRFL